MIDLASLGSIPFRRLNTPVAVAAALFCGVTSLSIVDASVVERFDAGKLLLLSFFAGSPAWFLVFITCRLALLILPIGWRGFSGSEADWLDQQQLMRKARNDLLLGGANEHSPPGPVRQAVLELRAEQGPDFEDRLKRGVRSTTLVLRGFRERNTELAIAATSGLVMLASLVSVRLDEWGVNTGTNTDLLVPAAAFTITRTVVFFGAIVAGTVLFVRVRRRRQASS